MVDKQFVEVHGRRMAHVELGDPDADPIVFLHGNPTSSFLWRHVMPHLADQGRCLAPDLIGMGDSEGLPDPGRDTYRFVEHRRFLDGWFEAVGATDRVTLVVHDWGSGLGFDRARRHPDQVVGIAFMEAIIGPASWDTWPDESRDLFRSLRSGAGEQMVLERNLFVERILPGSILRDLDDDEMEAYRRPFRDPGESRRPTLTWPREIPIDGEPADVHEAVAAYAEWLPTTDDLPKLLVNADPGALIGPAQRRVVRTWPHLTEVTVPGIHFLQEDSPHEIGRAIAGWRAGWA